MRCPRCGYEWKPKVPNPKECPRCKVRLDYKPFTTLPQGAPQKIKEVREEMTRKLPWIAAAVVIVVAVGLGSWLWLQPAAVTSAQVSAFLQVISSQTGELLGGPVALGLLPGPHGDFGIENIFIMIHGAWTPGSNPATWVKGENYYENISYNNATVNIPYERAFSILVVYKIRGDNVAYMRFENCYEYITISGTFTATENRLISGSDWENICPWYENSGAPYGAVGKDYPNAYVRFYNYIDNRGNGFKLPAGGSINFNLTIYTWK